MRNHMTKYDPYQPGKTAWHNFTSGIVGGGDAAGALYILIHALRTTGTWTRGETCGSWRFANQGSLMIVTGG